MGEVENASSWADMVRTIDHQRKNLPWDAQKQEPVQRFSTWERKKAEREYDVVSMRYNDSEREGLMQTKRLDAEVTRLNTVKDTRRKNFNIISHQGPPRKIDSHRPTKLTESNARPYNFVTNLTHQDHAGAPTLYDGGYCDSRAGRKPEAATGRGVGRPFDIVKNTFYEDNDKKMRNEHKAFREHTLERYWSTHDFDLVRGKFFDPRKEAVYQAQRSVLLGVNGLAQSLRKAPSVQYSDGAGYNIVNHHVHDAAKVDVHDSVGDRSLHRIKWPTADSRIKAEGQASYDKAEKAKLARTSFKRWEGDIDRGYDFIKNTTSVGPAPLPPRPMTMWARLQTEGAGGGVGGGGGGGVGAVERKQFSTTTGNISTTVGTVTAPPMSSGSGAASASGFEGLFSQTRTTRARDLSGGPGGSGGSAPLSGIARRASTALAPVPSLDLSRAGGEKISYVEPSGGSMGQSVAMVRTGGLSGYRD
ncbi:hypothetical protein B484DRAFT_393951 [Ochromonadaceae sp. CCMP2298]|nr:hypothetical protein B484DRAFT_393951 [Ochromonadaceae sp. CCMP2298]